MQITPIAHVQSCFKNKFGIPRQSGLAPSATAQIVFEKEFSDEQAFDGVEEIKFFWLITHFHLNEGWSPKVRPPRLGGNKSMGVFATRSPFRPNPIGLSLVENCGFKKIDGKIHMSIKNHDLAEGTPVLDIKPYHHELESLEDVPNWFSAPWKNEFPVIIHDSVREKLITSGDETLITLLEETLKMDPRPQYKTDDDQKHYFVDFDKYSFEWILNDGSIEVINLK